MKCIVKLENFSKSYGKKVIIKDLSLEIYEGEFLTLLGPSGCGKTTVLRAISGLDQVSSGKVYIDEVDVTNLDPTKREVNTLFQNYALFPFMTVEKNIGFGLKMKKVKPEEIEKRVKKMLKLVKLEGYEKRKPNQLSGGEQQRVSIARGLINNPKVLLLDEPLSALDQKLRKNMQIELKTLQKKLGITFVYVTHDQEEALSMSDRIVLLNHGKIEQIGTPEEIYRKPKTLFAADFIGESNIFDGIITKIEDKYTKVKLDIGQEIMVENDNYELDEKVTIVLRPEDLRLRKNSKKENKLTSQITANIYDGATILVMAKHNEKDIKVMLNCNDKTYDIDTTIDIEWDIDDTIVIRKKK